MKKIYVVVTIKENEKYYSYALPLKAGANIKVIFDGIINAVSFHLCESHKQARELVNNWNEIYQQNRTYMFEDAPNF